MFSTESVKNFISDVVTWVGTHEYADGSDNTFTSEDGYLSLTIRPGGISARAVLPVFSDNGRWEMSFTAERDAFTPKTVKEAVQEVVIEHDVMYQIARSLASYAWHVSVLHSDGKSLTAKRYGGHDICVHNDLIERSVYIGGNGQSLASMHLNNAGLLKISNNEPEHHGRYQIADWMLNGYDFED